MVPKRRRRFKNKTSMLWAKSLQSGDELDVCYGMQPCDWCVGTVNNTIKMNSANKYTSSHIIEISYTNSQRIWFSLPSDLSKIAKLHTHTSCNQCLKLRKTSMQLQLKHKIQCKDCELTTITTAIEQANIDILYYDIIKTISHYAIGFVIPCVNCNNIISFNSQSDFWCNQNKYSYYTIQDKYVNKYLIQKCHVVKVANGYTCKRFFCGICASKVKQCEAMWCRNRDTEQICFNHPRCSTCTIAKLFKINVCANYSKCGNYFCDKWGCGSEAVCKMCMVSSERNDISKSLAIAVNTYMIDLEKTVLNIIVEYSLGVIIECNILHCKQQIFISNKFEFDYLSRKKMIYYSPKHISLFNENEISSIYGKTLRVFCLKCIDYGLVSRCQYRYGNGDRCVNMDCQSICGDHSMCKECKLCTNNVCKNCMEFCCKLSQCNYKGHCKTCIIKNMTDDHKKCMQLKGESAWRNNLIICKNCKKYCCQRKKCSVKGKCKKCNINK